MNKHNKTFNFKVKTVGAEEDRVLRFIGSTETPDRDGDVISADGWELDKYLENPVFLWAHDYKTPPIGKAVRVWVENKKLMFDIEFPTADIHPLADTIYKLYRGGYLTATSVGFIGKQAVERDDAAVQGAPSWQVGVKFTRQELLELSAVPVPSNPTALQTAKAKGYITATEQESVEKELWTATISKMAVDAVTDAMDNTIDVEVSDSEIMGLVSDAVTDAMMCEVNTDCTSEEVAKMIEQAVSKAIGR